MAAGLNHSSTGKRQTSLHQPSHCDGHLALRKMGSSAPLPAVSTADQDKTWGQGQWRL